MSKKHWVLFAVIVFLLGLSLYPFFPDPYHEDESVNLWVWLWRELDELLHGEKEGGET